MPIELTINDKTISAEPGMTVLEAARANGIYIPTLCWAPRLPPFGGCRMCVVEIEKRGGFPTACTEPVAAGMVVRTETPAVQTQRRETLSLLLSEHPYTCLTCASKNGCVEFQGTIRKAATTTGCNYCPKNGQCEIQTVLDHVCLSEVPYPITYRNLPVEQDDPFFDRDMNLCIVCGRCVRACNDIRHAGVLGLIERGNHTIVGTAAGRSLVEAGCQFCGACVDACPTGALFDKKSKWEGVPGTITPSICPYCAVGCAVNVQTRSGRVLRAVGREGGLSNDGEVCMRGRFGMVDVVHNGARLKSPLAKRGLRLTPVSWDIALDDAAKGLAQYKGDEFAAIASATASNEDLFMLQKLTRKVMKSNNVALATAPLDGAAVAALKAGSAPIRDIRSAGAILVIGSNPFQSHPIVGLEIRHALSKGADLVVVDPRESMTAARAHVWLQAQAGTDHILIAGMLKEMAGDGLPVPLPMLKRISLRTAAKATGLDGDSIRAAAHLLRTSPPVMIIYGSGVSRQAQAANTIRAINTLAAALGAGVICLPGEGNVAGAYDMGAHPALLPGYRRIGKPGRDFRAILDGIRKGEVKALYLAGDVPPAPEWAKVPFLVVQGIVHSDVIKHAHVVLPATTFAEMDGTMTNMEGRVQRLVPAIKPVGEARPGWAIVQDIAVRLGAKRNAQTASDVLAEIAARVPAYAAISDSALDESGSLRRFGPPAAPQLARFSLDGPPPVVSGEYPIALVTERNRFAYCGVSLTREVKGLAEVKGENVVHVSSADAARLGIGDGQMVKVTSACGSVYWPACVGGLAEGVAFVSVNPVAGSPIFPDLSADGKTYAVRIEASE